MANNNMWELYDGYYIPFGILGSHIKGVPQEYGVDVYALKMVAPGNPYTEFFEQYRRLRDMVYCNIYRGDVEGRTYAANRKRLEKLRGVLEGVRPVMPDIDAPDDRIRVTYKVESVASFQKIVERCLDDYISLELDKFGLFDVPDKLGIGREAWMFAWRTCVKAMPERIKRLAKDMSVRDYRKNSPPVDWYKFIDQWLSIDAFCEKCKADGVDTGTATLAAVPASDPPASEPSVEPQIITDHTVTDDVLQGKRVMHNTAVAGTFEFGMQFDADADVLAACIRLLPQRIGRIWSSDLSVRCNALVARVTMDNLGEGYPIAESLNIEALKQVAADVDDLHRRVTMLVKAVDAVRGGVDLS